MSLIEINALGKPCPIPVIETKKVLTAMEKGRTRTFVDNIISTQNLEKMATAYGLESVVTPTEDGNFQVDIIVTQKIQPKETQRAETFIVAIGSETMGEGDDTLGKNLMKAFIQSLTELDQQPTAIVFFNSGAKLAIDTASTLLDLKTLAGQGISIVTCGACLDFFGITEKLAVGEITNMFTIATMLAGADRLVQL